MRVHTPPWLTTQATRTIEAKVFGEVALQVVVITQYGHRFLEDLGEAAP